MYKTYRPYYAVVCFQQPNQTQTQHLRQTELTVLHDKCDKQAVMTKVSLVTAIQLRAMLQVYLFKDYQPLSDQAHTKGAWLAICCQLKGCVCSPSH